MACMDRLYAVLNAYDCFIIKVYHSGISFTVSTIGVDFNGHEIRSGDISIKAVSHFTLEASDMVYVELPDRTTLEIIGL